MSEIDYSKEINGIILAGGLSTRYGSCKSLLELDKKSILKNTFELLSQHCNKVYISCREEKKIEGYPCIYDDYIVYAPMAGIYSALKFFKSPLLVLSCDLPFIDNNTLETLIFERNKVMQTKPELCMTTYQKEGTNFIESLVAIYEYRAKNKLKEALENEHYSLNRAISEEFRHHIPYSSSIDDKFFNINYPQDMKNAEKLINLQKCKKIS